MFVLDQFVFVCLVWFEF